jgi:hypothetical protein
MPTLLDLAGLGAPPLCASAGSARDGAGSGFGRANSNDNERPAQLCREGVSLASLLLPGKSEVGLRTAAFSQCVACCKQRSADPPYRFHV